MSYKYMNVCMCICTYLHIFIHMYVCTYAHVKIHSKCLVQRIKYIDM